ncbi:apolipoprotein N-acyltransferase [Hyphomicrobium sp.]|uniref:apolipoprotein N-acyltransferase n=1 Tax=Hyphomicrobium sp. TaxID=82 RepID=UPI0025C1CE70|nr:apolipoprotein N-acyltransferase [Hyphomicrobium sp.]MCC7252246.1 apolipoprotein N-acyltransferase [Hyphomicrobium sp.]
MGGRDPIGEWRRTVRALGGWRRAAVAFAAGALSNLAMAPFFFAPILLVTLPVLVWLIDGAVHGAGEVHGKARAGALAGWWFGFGYFLFGLFWIGEAFLVEADKFGWLLPFAVTLMPAGLALFWAVAAAVASLLWRPGFQRLLVLALALAAAEWLRGHVLTGFPWNVLGYALTWPLVLMQSAGLVGIYGLTLLTVPILAAPLVLAADAEPGPARWHAGLRGLAICGVPLVLLAAYGAARLATAPVGAVDGVKIRIGQPSVPQHEKWRSDKQAAIFQDHLALSEVDASEQRDGLADVTHVLWPEAAMPFLPLEHPEALAAIGEMLPDGVFLVTGALRREGAGPDASGTEPIRAYNSLMVFDSAGALASAYDKTHLVPFGEYLPWQSTLEAIGLEQLTRLRGGFSVGVSPRPLLKVPGLPPLGGLICYEAIFPGVGAQSDGRPGLLVNVTNDGWFGNTTGPRQHFHQARVRAVEEGVPLLRAANNGISAVIDSSGQALVMLGINVRGSIDSILPLARDAPPYAVLGDIVFLLVALLLAATLYFFRPLGGEG